MKKTFINKNKKNKMKKITAVAAIMVLFFSCKKETTQSVKENFSKTQDAGIYFENIAPGDTLTKSGKKICVFRADFFSPFEDATNTSNFIFTVTGGLSAYQIADLIIDGDNKGVSSFFENGFIYVNFRSKNPFYSGWHTLKINARVYGNPTESFSLNLTSVEVYGSTGSFRNVIYNNYKTGLITFK